MSSSGFQMFVKLPTGKTIVLDAHADMTFLDLKYALQDKIGIPARMQRLRKMIAYPKDEDKIGHMKEQTIFLI